MYQFLDAVESEFDTCFYQLCINNKIIKLTRHQLDVFPCPRQTQQLLSGCAPCFFLKKKKLMLFIKGKRKAWEIAIRFCKGAKECSLAKNFIAWKEETYPTHMPSSISVGKTLSPSPTTNCSFRKKKIQSEKTLVFMSKVSALFILI